MTELTQLLNKYSSDKGTLFGHKHGFSEVYDDYFKNIKYAKHILEIGVQDGCSLRAWKEYFPEANIIGADIENKAQFNDERIQCVLLNQSDVNDLERFAKSISYKFDLIIDDGSHHMRDQQITLLNLLPLLNEGGIYIIEDLHTSHCNNGDDLYGRPVEIFLNKENTTLYFLENIDSGSVYLSKEENEYIKNNIKDIKIFKKYNEIIPAYGNYSITSMLIKKELNI